jgi:hypothetical protein
MSYSEQESAFQRKIALKKLAYSQIIIIIKIKVHTKYIGWGLNRFHAYRNGC